jgi:hypothetical protein
VGITILPSEADSILFVHADAVLPRPTALQRFETIVRWNSQVAKRDCPIQKPQPAEGNASDVCPPARSLPVKELFRVAVAE